MKKMFYFHVPKTAGSTLGNLLDTYFDKTIHHIEGLEVIKEKHLKEFDAVSGHVTYTNMNKVINLSEWTTVATFREPYSHVVSHIAWIRKLADSGEEKRFKEHPKVFQDMAMYMKTLDFSEPEDIIKLISYFNRTNFFYMHNTQTLYMDNAKRLNNAIKNMRRIDVVGITDAMDDFIARLFFYFDWGEYKKDVKNLNSNINKYNLNIERKEIRGALYPLVDKDLLLYDEVLSRILSDN